MSGFNGSMGVISKQRQMVILSLKKTGLGTPVISGSCASFCTITDNGVGDYTINFTQAPFAQVPEILVLSATDSTIVRKGTVTALAAQILSDDASGTPAESDFDLLVIGSLARDLVGP